MVGGVGLIDWVIVLQALNLIFEFLTQAVCCVTVLHIGQAIANHVGWLGQAPALLLGTLKLRFQVRQIVDVMVFDFHFRHPFRQAGDIFDWHTPSISQRVNGLGFTQIVFMLFRSKRGRRGARWTLWDHRCL